MNCEEIRKRVHLDLDGDRPGAAADRRVAEHLASCTGCRAWTDEHAAIQSSLRSLSELQLPDLALQRIWRKTSRSGEGPVRSIYRHRGLRAVAVAAMVIAAAIGTWSWRQPSPPAQPSEAELQVAAHEARIALELVAGALRRTRRVAVRDVLVDEVSGTLRKVPVEWPESSNPENENRRNKT